MQRLPAPASTRRPRPAPSTRPGGRAPRWPLWWAALLALAGLLLGGCAQVDAQLDDTVDPSLADQVVPTPLLESVQWAELNGLVSVTVRNPTRQVLRRADALIRVLDADGQTLATSDTSGIEVDCCTAVNVAPLAQVGFYVQIPDGSTQEVADVEVSYSHVTFAATTTFGGPVGKSTQARLRSNSLGTQVDTRIATTGGIIERALVQATVLDRDGDLLAVVSTTWDCLRPDQETVVRLQLFHEVPRSAQVGTVTVFPDDRERTDRPAPSCR